MGFELSIILAYAFGLILLYILGWILLIPIRLIIKLIWNGVIGGIMLFLVNLVGSVLGIAIVINPITALVAGFLGVPGVVLLLVLQYIL
ncbi:pro-sigmaK processing inhibitor BofA family protein [Clostridium formicaceticum]|nr:pro-sigmaK processing inhibitor BofA family protein [Clostridium formicaceticum]ARE89809.1 SigmaK-factor processing regulatory protein BofA [Clostridium formicaceticum]